MAHLSTSFDEQFCGTFAKLLAMRRDVRRFRPDPLPPGKLAHLLQLACLAPSVGFSQPWRWVQVDAPERRDAIVQNFKSCNQEALSGYSGDQAALYARLKLAGLAEAPVHLALFVDPVTAGGYGLGRRTMPEMLSYSAVCAVHTLWLAARMHGIGMGWVSILDPVAVRDILAVPETWNLIAYLCLGLPEEESDRPELELAGWELRHPEHSTPLPR